MEKPIVPLKGSVPSSDAFVGEIDYGGDDDIEFNQFYTPRKGEVFSGEKLEKHEVVFDTGAGVTAFPRCFGDMFVATPPRDRGYKSAAKDCKGLKDEGGRTVKCVTDHGVEVPVSGRIADIRQVLLSGAGITVSQDVLLTRDGGLILPRNGQIASHMCDYLEHLKLHFPEEAAGAIPMHISNGVFKLDLWTKASSDFHRHP